MPVKSRITSEQVGAAVQHFWLAFTSKSSQQLADFYAHESSVFGSESTRTEPGRLAAARRHREYFHTQSVLKAETSQLEVIVLDDHTAVATYVFKFHATKVASLLGNRTTEEIEGGRATQVFRLEPSGALRIVHEHLSLPVR